MNNETQRKAQQNTRIIRLCSIQGMQDMEFQLQKQPPYLRQTNDDTKSG